jgi:hypothetical protein
MNSEQSAVILKRFEAPDEIRVLEKGRFELVHLGGHLVACGTASLGKITSDL